MALFPRVPCFCQDTLYGTAEGGGASGTGTIFKVRSDGSGFTTLYSFSRWLSEIQPINSEGIAPMAGLTLSGDTLYGTAFTGGSGMNGTVFSVNTNGDNLQILHTFSFAQPKIATELSL